MRYFLRQMLPPGHDTQTPAEIDLVGDETHVNRATCSCLRDRVFVSKKHAVFFKSEDGAVLVRDDGSRNGLYVNDVRVGTCLKLLKLGDRISFGVTSSQNDGRGFVCAFCSDTDPEVIDLTAENAHVSGDSSGALNNDRRSPVRTIILNASGSASRDHGSATSSFPRDTPECVRTREWVVHLVRCDSEDFKWPPDVKRTCLKASIRALSRRLTDSPSKESCIEIPPSSLHTSVNESQENGKALWNGRKKRSRVLSSDSSSAEEVVSDSSFSPKGRVLKHIAKRKALSSHRKKQAKVLSSDSFSEEEVVSNSSFSPRGRTLKHTEMIKEFSNHRKKQAKELSSDSFEGSKKKAVSFSQRSNSVKQTGKIKASSKSSMKRARVLISSSSDENITEESPRAMLCANEKSASQKTKNEQPAEHSIGGLKTVMPVNTSNYSVQEECILISDDETYLKPGPSIDCVSIKQEREEIDDFDDKDVYVQEIFGSDSDDSHNYRETCSGFQSGETESIESIWKFVNKNFSEPNWPSSHDNNSALKNTESSSVPHQNSNELPCENFELRNSCNLSVNNGQPPVKNCSPKLKNMTIKDAILLNNKNKSKVLLTDPKPMIISRKSRGRSIPVISPSERSERNRQLQLHQESRVQCSKNFRASQICVDNDYTRNKVNSSGASRAKTHVIIPPKRPVISVQPRLENRQTEGTNGMLLHDRKAVTHVNNSASTSAARATPHAPTNSARYTHPASDAFDSSSLEKSILMFNPRWLDEQIENTDPPPMVMEGAASVPLSFSYYESYVKFLYPMIKLEIWSYMYTEYMEAYITDNKERTKRNQIFKFSILKQSPVNEYVELKCESVIEEDGFCPREGMVALFELKFTEAETVKCNKVFGYIFKHKVEPLSSSSPNSREWKTVLGRFRNDARHWTYYVRVKRKECQYDTSGLMKGKGIGYIRNKLRLADALFCLRESPLMKYIIKPEWPTFALECIPSPANNLYSSRQIEIIEGISCGIKKPQEPKINLLLGPPGSGKTQIIIGIIERLFCSTKSGYDPNLKVLVAAPSNVAVDEIGSRLVKLNEGTFSRNPVRFVRVGLEKQVDYKVMPYFIDRQAKDLYRMSHPKWKELQTLSHKISTLEREQHFPEQKRDELKKLKEHCRDLQKKIRKMDYGTQIEYSRQVLKHSQVVLSTLSVCGQSLIRRNFKPGSDLNFSCCIVDDSTQCTELHILEPLMSGVGRLVLMGDSHEMPATVYSDLSRKNRLDRSMLERFHEYFQVHHKGTSPAVTLTEQFRMHSSICHFPSQYLYKNELHTHPGFDDKYRTFPLQSYIVLDIVDTSRKAGLARHIACEVAEFVSNGAKGSTALIVPQDRQREEYKRKLRSCKGLEVGTVSKFLGREFDATVLCAFQDPPDNPNSPDSVSFIDCGRRLNVALTRARKCLVICMRSAELKQKMPMWQALIEDAEKRKVFFSVSTGRDTRRVLRDCSKDK